MKRLIPFLFLLLTTLPSWAQEYYFGKYGPFDSEIPSPEEFLGYPVGAQHTRHDRIVAYFEHLAEISPRATIETYGHTYERRPLVMLTVSTVENLANLGAYQQTQLQLWIRRRKCPRQRACLSL